jgi:hypothetical protein
MKPTKRQSDPLGRSTTRHRYSRYLLSLAIAITGSVWPIQARSIEPIFHSLRRRAGGIERLCGSARTAIGANSAARALGSRCFSGAQTGDGLSFSIQLLRPKRNESNEAAEVLLGSRPSKAGSEAMPGPQRQPSVHATARSAPRGERA